MTDDRPKSSFLPLFFRLYWMIVWAFPSMVLVSFLIDKKIGNNAYFLWPVIFLTMIGAKYIDIKFYNGYTADGKPATMSDFKKYCLYALLIMFGLSILGFFILARR